ncbi:MAG: hypothetical protein QNJ44_01550 [Rhodobacter sp.]|nr:hypothetical protein [Rhodobacter sp.]
MRGRRDLGWASAVAVLPAFAGRTAAQELTVDAAELDACRDGAARIGSRAGWLWEKAAPLSTSKGHLQR